MIFLASMLIGVPVLFLLVYFAIMIPVWLLGYL